MRSALWVLAAGSFLALVLAALAQPKPDAGAPPVFLPASKSFGGAPLVNDGFGGLGMIGTVRRDAGFGLGSSKRAPGELTLDAPVVEGPLEVVLVQKVLQRNRAQLRYCVERELSKAETLAGELTIFSACRWKGAWWPRSSSVRRWSGPRSNRVWCNAQGSGCSRHRRPK